MKPYYEHAGIVIYHGDWRQMDHINNGDKYSLLLTDPPYGINEADPKKNASRGKRTSFAGKSNALAYTKEYPKVDNWDSEPIGASDIALLRCLAHRQIIFGGNYFQLPPLKMLAGLGQDQWRYRLRGLRACMDES